MGASRPAYPGSARCVSSGIGMFVEAYLIITTGQIKSIWHAAHMLCPQNIACCGLYPNTPVSEDGSCAVETSGNVFVLPTGLTMRMLFGEREREQC